jgi:hypothetical protein
MRAVPTVLFESGHFPHDYEREVTRKMIFTALISGLTYIYENDIVGNKTDKYLQIPQNKTSFYDIIYKNVKINYDNNKIITNFALQYTEIIFERKVLYKALIADVGALQNHHAHLEIDAEFKTYSDFLDNNPKIDQEANFMLDHLEIRNGLIQNI